MKRKAFALLALVAAFCGALVWWRQSVGASHREIVRAVAAESQAVQRRVDERADAIDRRLDRIEAKLDRLLEMATPRLPDGMTRAEGE